MSNVLPLPLRVYLIRHGQTAWSSSERHAGLTDIALSAVGEQQVRRLAAVLGALAFAKVLTSPQRRARQTCALAGFDRRRPVRCRRRVLSAVEGFSLGWAA